MATVTTGKSVYGESYGGTAPENYERYFVPVIGGPLAADLVADAALLAGERVLDVACGTGVVARLAAERVGTGGTVAGLDLNAGMLAVARAKSPPAGPAIHWYETSAESIPLPDGSFDVVFCQLGLQFMADKTAALREMRRVLAPGGRLLLSTARPTAFFGVLDRALARHIGAEAAGFVSMVFSLNEPTELERLLQGAGLPDNAVRVVEKRLHLPPARDFLWQYVHCTPLTGMLPEDREAIVALESDVVAGWQPWSTGDGLTYEQGMVIATASR